MPGPPRGPFIADHQHFAFFVLAQAHRLETGLLGIEASRRARNTQLVLGHASDLDDRAFRREIAAQSDDAAGRRDGPIGRVDDVLFVIPMDLRHVLGDGPASDGEAIAVQKAVVEQCLHQERNAASLEHVLGDIFAARLEISNIGRPLEDFGHVEQIERYPAFVGDRRQVQGRIGRARRTPPPRSPHFPAPGE